MNYLEPADVVDEVVAKLNNSIADFVYNNYSVKVIAPIAKKPDTDDGVTPPWIAVAYFFCEDGQVLPGGHIYNLPVSIAIICSSTPGQKTDADALREAFHYARIAYEKITTDCGELIINVGTQADPDNRPVILKAAKQPFEILEAGADLSLVGVFFEYNDSF